MKKWFLAASLTRRTSIKLIKSESSWSLTWTFIILKKQRFKGLCQFIIFRLLPRVLIPRIVRLFCMLIMSMIMSFHVLKKNMELGLWQKLWMPCNTFLHAFASIIYQFIKLHIQINLIHTLHLRKTSRLELTGNQMSFHSGLRTWTGIVFCQLIKEERCQMLNNPVRHRSNSLSKWKHRVHRGTLLMYKDIKIKM